ncbi:helix-turn-helix domain-containing protein [Chryseobacterium sp. Mn2064]|uniref:helix-turn-helix domain-containing protein n=1 Tax=Chryseobacterium sp. Mn2064 TaxID=3395263 RepID=UPI003BD10F68
MPNIPRYKPEDFSAVLKADSEHWKDQSLKDFLILKFPNKRFDLLIPLLSHRKTVNDLVFVTGGHGEQTIYQDRYNLNAGSFRILAPEKIRTIDTLSSDFAGYYCHFSDDFISRNSDTKVLHEILNHLEANNNYKIDTESPKTQILTDLLERITALNSVNGEKKNVKLIGSYLTCFLEETKEIIKAAPQAKLNADQTLVLRFKKEVIQHICEFQTIAEYAGLLHITPNHLNKCVKKITGDTASEFINKSLITEAKALLAIQEMNISDVAYHIGMDDPSYFARFFKKHTNISPTKYRKMIALSL